MNRRTLFCSLWAVALTGLMARTSSADIPPRPVDIPPGQSATPLVVKVDPTKDVSFLRIPREQLKEAIQAKDAKQSWLPGRTQSMIAAMAASIGLASVFLLRGQRNTKIVVLFVTGLIASGAVAQAWWEPAPGRPPFATPTNFSGEVVIEPTDGFQVELIIGTKLPPQRRGRPGPPSAPREKDA